MHDLSSEVPGNNVNLVRNPPAGLAASRKAIAAMAGNRYTLTNGVSA